MAISYQCDCCKRHYDYEGALIPIPELEIDVCGECLPILTKIQQTVQSQWDEFTEKMSVAYGVAAVKQVNVIKFLDWMGSNWTSEADKIFGTNTRKMFEDAKKAVRL